MKKREHDKKNKNEQKIVNEVIEIFKQFMETQIEVNKFRIKHFQEFDDCLNCDGNEENVSTDESESFSEKFEEEWA